MNKREMEKKVIGKLIDDILAAGHSIDLDDGEDLVLKDCRDKGKILKELFATDEEQLFVRYAGVRVGGIQLIYGNDGYDVITDYSLSIEHLLKGAEALAESLENEVRS